MAAGRHLGGLAAPAFPAVVLMRACFDWVLVETVGVGQSETEIADCADLVLLCVQPGSGDALQFMKAGIMEVPDLVLVTKGDLGAPARRAARDLRGALSLAAGPEASVALVSARTGEGLADVLELDLRLLHRSNEPPRAAPRAAPRLGLGASPRIVRTRRIDRPDPHPPRPGLPFRVAPDPRKPRRATRFTNVLKTFESAGVSPDG